MNPLENDAIPSPDDVAPEDRTALAWLENVYQGDTVRQLG